MSATLTPDLGNRFQSFHLEGDDLRASMQVSPMFLAYLQNKIATYAGALVDSRLDYDADPAKQVKAILEHERLRNFVAAYEELLLELTDASSTTTQPSQA